MRELQAGLRRVGVFGEVRVVAVGVCVRGCWGGGPGALEGGVRRGLHGAEELRVGAGAGHGGGAG